MWFMNLIFNPFVRLILRSPFHRLMSKNVMLITYQGQKTGREYTLPVQYAEDSEVVYVIPGMPEKKIWWHNIHKDTPVRIQLRERSLNTFAGLLTAEHDLDVIARVLGIFLKKFPASARLYHLEQNADGDFNPDELRKTAANLILVNLKPIIDNA